MAPVRLAAVDPVTDLAVADRETPEIERLLLAVLSKTPTYVEVDEALRAGAFDDVVALLSTSWGVHWRGKLWLNPDRPDLDDPLVAPFARIGEHAVENASRILSQLSAEARASGRLVIADSIRERRSRSDTVNLIRRTVGLTYRQTNAVLNQWRVGVTAAVLTAAVLRHRQVRARALAKTEAVRAANRDFKTGSRAVRFRWSTAEDERTCDYCAPLDGRVTDEDPPAHPNCRCTLEEVLTG